MTAPPRHRLLLATLAVVALALVGATAAALRWRQKQAADLARFDELATQVDYRLAHVANVLGDIEVDEHMEPPVAVMVIDAHLVDLDALATRIRDDGSREERLASFHARSRAVRDAIARNERARKDLADRRRRLEER